ncbi:MAG TPA: FIST N-terminal domain-containing protein [Thermoleophilaceae bacterium]|nr:FIST N-terminal domain-containing protein [Thermoleophilaceae bacterium]
MARAVAGVAGPELVLIFPDSALGAERAFTQAVGAARGVPVVGMTTNGSIASSGAIAGGCSALAFGDQVTTGIGVADQASAGLWAAGYDAAGRALAGVSGGEGQTLLILFLDSSTEDQSAVAAGAAEVAGPEIPIVGGASGADGEAQFGGGTWGRDRVVAVALRSPAPIGIGIADGAALLPGDPAVITAADGRALLRLDDRPAEDVLLERIGLHGPRLSDERFAEIASVHPLLLPDAGHPRRLRHVFGRLPGGGIGTSTKIPAGTALQFTRLTSDAIVESTYSAAVEALEPLAGEPARAALIFDCSGRLDALGGHGPALHAEAGTLVAALGIGPEVAGAYTRGEFGRLAGATQGDLNHSLVVVAFG